MIGAFARMFNSHRKKPESPETAPVLPADVAFSGSLEAPDAPPQTFVDSVPGEGGTIYVSPILERMRALRRKERAPTPTPSGPEARSRPSGEVSRP
jgi:hypothetical protein